MPHADDEDSEYIAQGYMSRFLMSKSETKEILGANGATTPIISDVHFETALTSSCYDKERSLSVFEHTFTIISMEQKEHSKINCCLVRR